MKKYTHVSLFAGAGGLDIGFEQAGFETIWANDSFHDACETHRAWCKCPVIEGDIAKVDFNTIPDCDIASGGFPCFVGKTKILMKDGLLKEIKDIVPGDVISYKNKEYKVKNFFNQGFKEVVKIKMEDGYKVTCTLNHKFLCKDGDNEIWIEARNLLGKDILKNDGTTTFVHKMILLEEEKEVFDIEVEDVHCFVLENGVIAHNCQGFSLSGPRKIDDSRNTLYKYCVKLLEVKKPKIFLAENVKGFLTLGNGSIKDAVIKDFEDKGYEVCINLFNTKDYHVPEDRQRIIIVAIRKDLVERYGVKFEAPKPFGDIITIRQALKDIEKPNKEDICWAPYSSRYMSRNRKRSFDDVSFTIPAMAKQVPLYPGSPDMKKIDKDLWEFGEGETRRFSYKEAAAIQTFPKDMQWKGDLISIYKQIGNAVPCEFARILALELIRILDKCN